MRIGFACWVIGILWTRDAGFSGWLAVLAPVMVGLGGFALSSKLDAIAQAADRD